MTESKYKRVLLKFSGEVLAGKDRFGINHETVKSIAEEISDARSLGVQIGLVLGGGNIIRGMSQLESGIARSTGDYMGMLGTIINALAMQSALENCGIDTRAMTAIKMDAIAEPYIHRRAMRHFERGRIVIFCAGTGSPYFTTDTAAALRAIEVGADVIIKGTKVDGVFDKDPEKEKDAKLFKHLTYMDVLEKNLKVMDSTAISLCMDNKMPIQVYNMRTNGNLRRLLTGENIGTLVSGENNA